MMILQHNGVVVDAAELRPGLADRAELSPASTGAAAGVEDVGERCRKLKIFLRFHQDPSMSSSKQRVMGERLHLHTTL